jgi:hypothetical protein
MASAAGGSMAARNAHMRPPKLRPTSAMRSAPSARRASRASRRSASSRAYPALGREPRVLNVTARVATPYSARAFASALRIGWSAVPP